MSPPVVRIVSSSSVATTATNEQRYPHADHIQKRFFIGPLPQNTLPVTKRDKRKHTLPRTGSEASDEELSQVIRNHARNFFLREGGREEDWGDDEMQSTRQEMLRRWKESEWGVALRRFRGQSDAKSSSTWIGGSFEIGNLAGMNIMEESLSKASSQTSIHQPASFIPLDTVLEPLMSSGLNSLPRGEQAETFITTPSESLQSKPAQPQGQLPSIPSPERLLDVEGDVSRAASPSSSTALLHPSISRKNDPGTSQTQSEPARRPIIKLPSFSRTSDGTNKVKKTVHYLSPVESSPSISPASPAEVLERTGTDVSGTSAGAMSISAMGDQPAWGDVIMRDRMLVRVYSSDSVDLFSRFDESIHRVTRHLKYEDWGEFLVAWRKNRVEIYENYAIGCREWITHHKKLAYIIDLKDSRTRLFQYSFVDLTFCITCGPTSRRFNPVKAKWTVQTSKEGSNIFIFKLKSRTRAFDWIWNLWKFRSGTFPPVVEVGVPRLDNRLKIDMPNVDDMQTYKIFSKDNLIALSIHSLRAVPDWKFLVERQLKEGNVLQLCWRQGSYLDWIWFTDDVEGRPRDWAVLCGLSLKQLKVPVQLELRLAEHRAAYIHQKDGSRLPEPPSIEGYVDRVRPNSNTKSPLYLVTHEGNLFVLTQSTAYPPTPIGAALPPVGSDVDYALELRESEVRRGIQQLLSATGVVDLRSILVVRRANHPVMPYTHDMKEGDEDNQPEAESQPSQSDRDDSGGEEVLNKNDNKRELKMRRSFELLLKNGHVLRFETYSCPVALEWVGRLQALVHYWKMKHRNDAKEEMELAQTFRPLVTPHIYAEADRTNYAASPVDSSSPLPALGSLYNWCALAGCKPIVKSGKVFMRQGLHGQYRLVDLVLVPEHLILFRIKPNSVLHSSMKKKVNIGDAYVYSGYLAAQFLPQGQFDPTVNNVPRKYQDGLETDDPEEERLFVIWYWKTPVAPEEGESTSGASVRTVSSADVHSARSTVSQPKIPPLNAKRKIAIFRTRSRLERDAWCWALNNSIEKAVRARKERERKIRESGGLMNL